MFPMGIILLLSHAADFLSANSTEPFDCILAEEKCLKDSRCRVSYHDFKKCSRTDVMDQVNTVKCEEATAVLSQNSVFQCKCQRRKKEEQCLNIYWTLHPDYVHGYLDSYDSPYLDEKVDKRGEIKHSRLAAESVHDNEPNGCLKETNICSSNAKCIEFRNEYVEKCTMILSNGSCDREKCHHSLREFFKKVQMEFTKNLLFCQCNQQRNCAERRRQYIVPKCSFEEKVKKNCLELRDTCLSNNLCKSRFLDYQNQCQLFDKKMDSCPQENHRLCIQSYIRMIGTAMTPNFINNLTMKTSLWCTCEGSGNQEDDCKNLLSMFTSNKCLKNAIKMEFNTNEMDIDPELENVSTDKEPILPAFPSLNQQVDESHTMQVLPVQTKLTTNTASGGLSLNIAWTLLCTALFSL